MFVEKDFKRVDGSPSKKGQEGGRKSEETFPTSSHELFDSR